MSVFQALGLLFLLIIPVSVSEAQINAGFVEGLWYSKTPVFADDTVRIYSALRNNTGSDLTGTVLFQDGNSIIARKDISALSGRLIETWADWSPSFGDHVVTATLTNVHLHAIGEGPENINAPEIKSESKIFVDRDTDQDGVGNEEDTDDDEDGISDVDEIKNGTDPLIPNEPEEESVTDAEEQETAAEQNVDENQPPKEDASTRLDPEQMQAIAEGLLTDATESSEGFERYFDEGPVDSILSNVTERIAESKTSLDTYREERKGSRNTATDLLSDTNVGTTSEEDGATITRSHITEAEDSPGLFATMISGLLAIVSGMYTLLLWIISKLLSYPGLVQFLLLLTILIGIYKLVRGIGRRRQP